MHHIEGPDRDQLTLFPEALDDYIAEDNAVRFLDAFVGTLDLVGLDFTHAVLKETGRPPYHPADLLKLYVYGYLNRIRSSRQLEREAGRNVEVMWLVRRLRPDLRPSPTSGATTARPSSRCAGSSRCMPGGCSCLRGTWWPSTGPSSRRSTAGRAT